MERGGTAGRTASPVRGNSAVPAKPSQKKPAFSVAGPLAGLRGISLFRKPVCVDKQDFRAESACVRKTVMLVRPVEDLPRHDGSTTVRVYPISGRDGTGVQSLRRSWLHLHQRQLLALPLRQQRLVYLRQRRSGAAHLKAEYHLHHTAGRQRPTCTPRWMPFPWRFRFVDSDGEAGVLRGGGGGRGSYHRLE